eukprot:s3503_g4.t1
MNEGGQQVEKKADISMLLPHQWSMALQAGDMLEDVTCTPEELSWLWKFQERRFQMSKEMFKPLDFENPSLLPVPWCLHGDSAPFTEVDSWIVVSMKCLLTKRPIGESQLLLYVLPKAASAKQAIQSLNETLAWSFSCLAQGAAPKKNKDGNAERERQALQKRMASGKKQNLQYFALEFGFPYPGRNYLCPYCLADQFLEGSAKPFTDMRQDAAWRTSILTERELQEENCSHSLLKMKEVNVSAIKLDALHMLDLGVAAYMHGSVLVEIMNQLGGRSRGLGDRGWQEDEELEADRCPAQSRGLPLLRHQKGAQIRAFAAVRVQLCKVYCTSRAEKHCYTLESKPCGRIPKPLGAMAVNASCRY